MKQSTAKHQIHESFAEQIRKEKGQQDEIKHLTRRSILKILQRAKSSQNSYAVKQQIEEISDLNTLEALLSEIWSVKDIAQLGAIINKYEWLEEMKKLDLE